MLWRSLPLIILFCAMASMGNAGPWPREDGRQFLSFSSLWTAPQSDLTADQSQVSSVFFERGLPRDLTLGFDGFLTDQGASSFVAFVKRPILKDSPVHRFALRAGLGVSQDVGAEQTVVALGGFYWGRGFESPYGPGWATLDFQTHARLSSGDAVVKADVTVGVSPNDNWKVIMQAQSGAFPGSDPFLRLAPSVVRRIGEGRHIELGGQVGLVGDDRAGIKLGAWLEF